MLKPEKAENKPTEIPDLKVDLDTILEKNNPKNLDLSKHQLFIDTTRNSETFNSLEISKPNQNIINHSDEDYDIPTWLFVLPPSLFNYVPLCILIVSYCMIWVKIKRSNVRIEGMVAFNKHKNEVRVI